MWFAKGLFHWQWARLRSTLSSMLITRSAAPTEGGLVSIFDKAKEALNSEKAEQVSDQALDRAEALAKSKAGAEHHDKISGVRDSIDKQVGTE